jgi:hypothetical protein
MLWLVTEVFHLKNDQTVEQLLKDFIPPQVQHQLEHSKSNDNDGIKVQL